MLKARAANQEERKGMRVYVSIIICALLILFQLGMYTLCSCTVGNYARQSFIQDFFFGEGEEFICMVE